ncbi:MAG TPA: hypothetical protein O0X27_07035, partial [Methanocorpusculum sp.]|nr:hypothetical protein [Methanocorpusculum sp.]
MERNLLIIGALALVVIGCIFAAGCTSQDAAYQPDRVYDLEHHYYLPELLDYLGTRTEYPYLDESGINFAKDRAMPIPTDLSFNSNTSIYTEITDLSDLRLGIMDEAGISTGVVSSSIAIELLPK